MKNFREELDTELSYMIGVLASQGASVAFIKKSIANQKKLLENLFDSQLATLEKEIEGMDHTPVPTPSTWLPIRWGTEWISKYDVLAKIKEMRGGE